MTSTATGRDDLCDGASAEEHRLPAAMETGTEQVAGRHQWLESEVQRLRLRLQRTERALMETRATLADARRRADHDLLTGLPNRRAFTRLGRHRGAGGPDRPARIGVLFIDLDDFKAVNDRFGHAAGDAVLRVVAARMTHAVRQEDIVYRIGGDEFVCVLMDVESIDQARAVATKLLSVIQASYRIGPTTVQIGASIGIALPSGACADVAVLSRRADEAMYLAKTLRSGIAVADAANGAGIVGTTIREAAARCEASR